MRTAKIFLIMSVGIALGSCTFPHPLQDEVTRLPLSDIIHKITCEAKDALDDLLIRKGIAGKRDDFEKANKNLKALAKRVLKPREAEGKELDQQKQKLLLTKSAIETEGAAINQILKDALKKKPDEMSTKEKNRLIRFLARQKQLDGEWVKYNEDLAVYSRTVRKHNVNLSIAQSRVDAATKETKRQIRDLAPYYKHQMAYNFRFRAVETNAATAIATYRFPIHLGTLTIGASGGDTKERDGERNAKLVVSFEDLHGTRCDDAPPQAGRLRAVYYPIRGKIGLEEVIAQYLAILGRGKNDREKEPQDEERDDDGDPEKAKRIFAKTDAYTDTIIFTTTLTGSVTPSITLSPTSRELITGSLGISGTRKDIHTVVISLSVPDSDDTDKDRDKITRVQIISDDLLSGRN